MILGMDFGTTNTGAATFDGESIRLLPLDPNSPTPVTCRTAIYITRGRQYHLGSEALDTYYRQNIGRPTRFVKVRVGEIIQVFAEIPTFYRDVYVYEDIFSPGRLFTSIKTALRNPSFFGTVYQGAWYSSSDLVAIFLLGMKLRIENLLGEDLKEIVLGRPVRFSEDPTEDHVAQSRLLDGAFKAGFEKVYLEYEPVAAALSYEKQIQDKEVVLVFDFGGGTLDFTVIELGTKDRKVLATGGIPIAGDVFDQRLFRVTIPPHLGEHDFFVSRGKRYPIPAYIFDQLSNPQEILGLNTPQQLDSLRAIHQGALHKEKTAALLDVVSSNYALRLFDLIEHAKQRLSSETDALLEFNAENIRLRQNITRLAFERAIHAEYERIRTEMLTTLERSGLRPGDIDRVIRTGGSSQIPLFVRMLHNTFGYPKVRQVDVFSSVTSGLAIRGHELSCGMAEAPSYSMDAEEISERLSKQNGDEGEVRSIDLDRVRDRFLVAQNLRENHAPTSKQEEKAAKALLILDGNGLQMHALPPIHDRVTSMQLLGPDAMSAQGLILDPDNRVVLATSLYKFMLLPAQAFFTAAMVGQSALNELIPLEADEVLTALALWGDPEETGFDCFYMITHRGQARRFDARLLRDQLLARPYFRSEHNYAGGPAFLLLAPGTHHIHLGMDTGRVATTTSDQVGLTTYDVIKARHRETVTAVGAFAPDARIFALNDEGSLMIAPLSPPENGATPAARGKILRRNFHVRAFLDMENAEHHGVLTTHGRLLGIPPLKDAQSRLRPTPLFSLEKDDKVLCVVRL